MTTTMKLTYLGTSGAQGLPALFCDCPACRKARAEGGRSIMSRSQSLVESGAGKLLIDFPPDTYYHTIRFGLDLREISDCLITHPHGDHFQLEEIGIRGGFSITVPEAVPVFRLYGSEVTGRLLSSLLEHDKHGRYAFTQLEAFTPAKVGGYTVTPLPANHSKELHSFLYIIEAEGKKLFYANDTAFFDEETWAYLEGVRGLDFVSLDCAFTSLDKHFEHMGIPDCLKAVERLRSFGAVKDTTRYALTHFAHFGLSYQGIVEAVAGTPLEVAYDGYEVTF